MVILNLHLDNVLSFNDFSVNFTYPRKINSLINSEYLDGIPTFRYKKINVFVGSNATGKTSLCLVVWKIMLFIHDKEKKNIESLINDKTKKGYIEIDFVNKIRGNYVFYRLKIKTSPYDGNNTSIKISSHQIILKNGDTYEKVSKNLEYHADSFMDYLEVLGSLSLVVGFNVSLPSTEPGFNGIDFVKIEDKEKQQDYENIMNAVFKTLDPSIETVVQSKDSQDAYVIKHQNGSNIIVQKGMNISDINYLSSGTKYGFNIANMIFSIKYHINGFYVMDEQFSYINSDIEKAILSTIISLLGDCEQLFFTTHNSNILSMGIPFHSFYFMRKTNIDNRYIITVSCGSEKENRNNVSPKSLYDNDAFATAPDLNFIMDLGEKYE